MYLWLIKEKIYQFELKLWTYIQNNFTYASSNKIIVDGGDYDNDDLSERIFKFALIRDLPKLLGRQLANR